MAPGAPSREREPPEKPRTKWLMEGNWWVDGEPPLTSMHIPLAFMGRGRGQTTFCHPRDVERSVERSERSGADQVSGEVGGRP